MDWIVDVKHVNLWRYRVSAETKEDAERAANEGDGTSYLVATLDRRIEAARPATQEDRS